MKFTLLFIAVISVKCAIMAQDLPMDFKRIITSDSIHDVQAAIPKIVDPDERRQAQLRLAQLLYNSPDLNESIKADAIKNYQEALADRKNFSLNALSARNQLASLLLLEGKSSEAIDLLREVIDVKSDQIFHDEFTPEYLNAITMIDPRLLKSGITKDSPLQKEAIERRLEAGKRNVLDKYDPIRNCAARALANEIYRSSGIGGLKRLLSQYKNLPSVQHVIYEVMADKLSNSKR